MIVQNLWRRKVCQIVCRVPRKWMKSKFLYQDVDVVFLAYIGVVIDAVSAETMTKFSWRLESYETSSGSLKMDLCLVLAECFNRQILRFSTSLIDLIYSERVSRSTSSFFAHRLEYASYASMMISKFWCHENETGSLNVGPLRKRSLSVSYYVRYWDHLLQYGHMEHKEIQSQYRHKVVILGKTMEVDLLQTCFIIENLSSNWTGIAIGNAWRLLVCNMGEYYFGLIFWFKMLLKFKASMPLLANFIFRNRQFFVPSLWDLHMFFLLRPILFRTCRYFTGLCSSNIPRYFLDFALYL